MSDPVQESTAVSDIRNAVNDVANQLGRAVDGDFNFVVASDSGYECIQKLSMLVNFVADAARRSIAQVRRQNEEMRTKEARYRELFANMSDGVAVYEAVDGGRDFVFKDINNASSQIEGVSPDEVIGRRVTEAFPGVEEFGLLDVLRAVFRTGTPEHFPARFYQDHRISGWRENYIYQLPTKEVVAVYRDISVQKKAEETLKESEERYRTLFEGAGEGILVADIGTKRFLYCNRTWCDMFGYTPEEVLGLGESDIHPADAMPRVISEFEALARGEKSLAPDLLCRCKDGSVFFADVRTSAVTLKGRHCQVGFFTDASERKAYEKKLETERGLREQAEIELRHAQKLQAVGQLAAGIAHEINTPAQFVGDNIRFLQGALGDTQKILAKYREALAVLTAGPGYDKLAEELKEAEDEADLAYIEENAPAALEQALDGVSRISTIVRAMKEFAHPAQAEKSPTDINRALQATLTIARNEFKYVADLETAFGELPAVLCQVGDLNQVFLNLLINAAHAIADKAGESGKKGLIRVRTRSDGDMVRIEIEDSGCGIPAAIRDRIFDPFFTTKEVGRGSGQGLTIARNIVVDKHFGSLTFESIPDKGTTFIILLPVDGVARTAVEARS